MYSIVLCSQPVAPEGEIIIAADTNVMTQKSRGENICWIFRRPGYLFETL
jgi:hypothetical protein